MTAVSVTADHIARGTPLDAGRCAVALALRDAFPRAEWIAVSGEGIMLQPRTDDPWAEQDEIPPPPEVAAFIAAYDGDLPVEPFTFKLDYPAAVTS